MKAVQQKCMCPVGFNGSACEKIVVENKVNMKNNQKTPQYFDLRFDLLQNVFESVMLYQVFDCISEK